MNFAVTRYLQLDATKTDLFLQRVTELFKKPKRADTVTQLSATSLRVKNIAHSLFGACRVDSATFTLSPKKQGTLLTASVRYRPRYFVFLLMAVWLCMMQSPVGIVIFIVWQLIAYAHEKSVVRRVLEEVIAQAEAEVSD